MAVNHFGHFALFSELKDLLIASSTPEFHSRVICVSSGVHSGSTVELDDLDWQRRKYGEGVRLCLQKDVYDQPVWVGG